MNVIIVEDELPASRKLEALLNRADPSITVRATFQTVKDTVEWISSNPGTELGFFDIQLSDDVSFSIFEKCNIDFPVVFVTAYDDYLLKAFEYNSLHYLLKPVSFDKIRKTLDKIENIKKHFVSTGIKNLFEGINKNESYKSRIIVRKGVEYAPVETRDIAYIFSRHKVSFVKDINNNIFMADEALAELQSMLDPVSFFRVNRQYIININSVVKFRSVENGKIKLEIKPASGEEIIVSKEGAANFRKWIGS